MLPVNMFDNFHDYFSPTLIFFLDNFAVLVYQQGPIGGISQHISLFRLPHKQKLPGRTWGCKHLKGMGEFGLTLLLNSISVIS